MRDLNTSQMWFGSVIPLRALVLLKTVSLRAEIGELGSFTLF